MRLALALGLLVAGADVMASAWTFSGRVVIAPSRPGVFHQLDSSGRQHVALSGQVLAVVWEDNRDTTPQVYVAFKPLAANGFGVVKRLSGGRSAAAPVIAALGDGRFVAAWEQDGRLAMRTLTSTSMGPVVKLDEAQAGQPSLAARGRVVLAYVRAAGRYGQIAVRDLNIDAAGRVTPAAAVAADPAPPKDEQQSPVVAVTRDGGATLVWEDRRRGHTVLFVSHAPPGKPFGPPANLNEQVTKSDVYGRGSGVTRVSLTAVGPNRLAAAWMDKRGFRTGYDIYAAVSDDAGRVFGKNEQVQDDFGKDIAQWRAAIAGNARGQLVAAFDDDRDDDYNIQLAVRAGDGKWSDNFSPPPATGAGDQSHPAMVLEDNGTLHLVWRERDSDGAPTRLFYSQGRLTAP